MVEYEIFIWVGIAIASIVIISRLVIIPLSKAYQSTQKIAKKVNEENTDALTEKNVANLAGGAAANWVDGILSSVEKGYKQAKEVYDKQEAECKRQNLQPADAEKILAPLRGKMKQAEFLLQNRDSLKEVNKALTAPLIGKLARKIVGGLF